MILWCADGILNKQIQDVWRWCCCISSWQWCVLLITQQNMDYLTWITICGNFDEWNWKKKIWFLMRKSICESQKQQLKTKCERKTERKLAFVSKLMKIQKENWKLKKKIKKINYIFTNSMKIATKKFSFLLCCTKHSKCWKLNKAFQKLNQIFNNFQLMANINFPIEKWWKFISIVCIKHTNMISSFWKFH